jgi:hypothetical protein
MARISELHYSNAYAASSGVSEFLEVALGPTDTASDFIVSFYNANGLVGFEVTLTDPGVQVSVDPDNGETIYVISADDFPILLTDPTGGQPNNYEAYALTDTTTSTVIDFYDIGGGTQADAIDGAAAGASSTNLPVLTGPNSTTSTLQFNQPNPNTLVNDTVGAGDTGIACFAAATLVDTPNGPKRIGNLNPGDLVDTIDRGPQPVRWIGRRSVAAMGRFAPVRFAKGTLGATRDILVSPQHRVLIQGWQSELLFGETEILVPALSLVNGRSVVRAAQPSVTYVHVLFDRHELIRASGFVSESFFPGDEGMDAISETETELAALFPEAVACAHRLRGLVRPAQTARMGHLLKVA